MKDPKSIRIDDKTKIKLDKVVVETTGVELTTYDDKINFLIWFYGSHKNNNGNH
ncbi:MAG: hypothetical protein QM490_02625 [Candidatus Gracilibacteria bacterium]